MALADENRALLDVLHEGVYIVDRERKITYWNSAAEQITGYPAGDVRGACCSDDLLVHVNDEGVRLCDGFCPAKLAMNDGHVHRCHMYLRHHEGHRVPVRVTITPTRNGNGEITGAVQAFSQEVCSAEIDDPIGELEQAALIDDLTGLANRRMVRSAIEAKFAEMNRYRWRFGVLFIDLDHFKSVNDTYGHEAGDQVLRVVARTLLTNARPFDVAGRWGGEEFLVLLANVNDEQLCEIADRFRVLIQQSAVPANGDVVHVTVSIGATLATTDDDARSLIQRADRLMYESKKRGRNRVSADRAA